MKKLGRIPDGGGWPIGGRAELDHRGAGRQRRMGFDYVRVAVDDHSRLAFARALPDEKGPICGGFQAVLAALGATHILTRPYSPWQNGKTERFNRTLQENWAYRHPFNSNQDRTDALGPCLDHYDDIRPRAACEGLPPISRTSRTQ